MVFPCLVLVSCWGRPTTNANDFDSEATEYSHRTLDEDFEGDTLDGRDYHFSSKVFFGLLLALLGAYILISKSSFSQTSSMGNVLAVLCSVAMAVVLIVGKNIRKSVGLFEYSRWLFLYASVCLFVVSFFDGSNIFEFETGDFGWFVFLAAIPTMVGHNIFYFLVKYLSTTTIAAVPLGEPLISSFGAYFLFGEPVSVVVFLGGATTLLGVFIIIKNDPS